MTAVGFGPLELWVGNARQAAAYFSNLFGFAVTGRAGPTTGVPDRVSYALQQGDITLILTGAATAESEVGAFVRAHGDGVRDIALVTDDAVADRPTVIPAFGDVVHRLLRPTGARALTASFEGLDTDRADVAPIGLVGIDHYAVSVRAGQREGCVRRYEDELGMTRGSPDQLIEVDESAFVMSTVRMRDGDGAFVFAEPAPAPRTSQISDFLGHFGGPGVHHLALSTRDIAHTMASVRARGIRTLPVPPSYLAGAGRRVAVLDGDVRRDWRVLADLGVMVDVDDDGYLLQAFTEPLGDRPTTYLEIIQREGTRGFGAQNVRDLYSTVLHDQAPSANTRV